MVNNIASINQHAFVPTENPSPDVARAEKAFMEQLKKNKPDHDKLNGQMILGKMEEWIKILITTLRNQDPTDPVDHKDMVSQFGMFAQTMGINEIRNFLEEFKTMMGTTQALEAAQQLDKLAKVEAHQFNHTKDAKVDLSFDMPTHAKHASIVVTDDKNALVRTMQGEFKPGENSILWDGKDNQGNLLPEGTYGIRVSALDKDGKQITHVDGTAFTLTTYVNGVIKGTEITPRGPNIKINGYAYPMDQLRNLEVLQLQEVKPSVNQNTKNLDAQTNNEDLVIETETIETTA